MEKNKSNKPYKPSEEQLITHDMLKIFYERPSLLKDDYGNPFPVPHEGSLGLLAIGHIGLIEWRKSKEKYVREKQIDTDSQSVISGNDI
jgi:hypothetical protein